MGKHIVVRNADTNINNKKGFIMIFKEKYADVEKKCFACGYVGKPLLLKNTFFPPRYFGRISSTQKKYILKCPKCNALIGSK